MSRAVLARTLTILVTAVSLQAIAPAAHAQGVALDGTMPQPLPLFPADNWWNVDVSQAPVDANSSSFISFIGTTRQLHPDWGGSAGDPGDPTAIYGIPYIVVPGTQPLVPVTFVAYPDESDAGARAALPVTPSPSRPKPRAAGSRAARRATSSPTAIGTC